MHTGEHDERGDGLWVEVDGRLYEMTISDEVPTTADGRRCLMVLDRDAQQIRFHRSVPPARLGSMIAEATGHDPRGAVWRLVPVDEQLWKHVPMVQKVD